MALRPVLSTAERDALLAIPTGSEELASYYTLSEADLSLVRQRRGQGNKLGFAAHLSLLRYPGFILTEETMVPEAFIAWVAGQIDVRPDAWLEAGGNEETRRQHSRELRAFLGLDSFGLNHYRDLVGSP